MMDHPLSDPLNVISEIELIRDNLETAYNEFDDETKGSKEEHQSNLWNVIEDLDFLIDSLK